MSQVLGENVTFAISRRNLISETKMAISIQHSPEQVRRFVQEYVDCLTTLGDETPEKTALVEIKEVLDQVKNTTIKAMWEDVLKEE